MKMEVIVGQSPRKTLFERTEQKDGNLILGCGKETGIKKSQVRIIPLVSNTAKGLLIEHLQPHL